MGGLKREGGGVAVELQEHLRFSPEPFRLTGTPDESLSCLCLQMSQQEVYGIRDCPHVQARQSLSLAISKL